MKPSILKYRLEGTEHQTKLAPHAKLDDDHNISTVWLINKNIDKTSYKSFVEEITAYGKKYNLNVIEAADRHLYIIGLSGDFEKAFDIKMEQFKNGDHVYHASTVPLNIPITWRSKIENVLGLNTNKVAGHYAKKAHADTRVGSTTFDPLQLAKLYNFPTGLDGTGQKIGVIELGGGYVLSDIVTYFSNLGIDATPNITAVSVDGAANDPSDTSGANVEVILDIEIIAALVPAAAMYVYFAPNTDMGFYDAINAAINNGCNIISISWGGPEDQWTSATKTSYNNLFKAASTKGITILAAAGDAGSSDGEFGKHVDFPSSSPYVLACGGTSIFTNDNINISREIVWHNSSSSATGGGISSVFTKPTYQAHVTYPIGSMRGVPDVAGNADPNTGYVIYSDSEGGSIVVGGTSAVAPLWSGLLARINQSIGHSVGYIHPVIYPSGKSFHDITSGSNGAYSATAGWDACTGLGTPNGQLLLALFAGNPTPPPPVINPPQAAFSISSTVVYFSDKSTNTPSTWSWNFGDGTNSTLQNPAHTYTAPGTYTVSLTVTNSGGSNSTSKTITIPQ